MLGILLNCLSILLLMQISFLSWNVHHRAAVEENKKASLLLFRGTHYTCGIHWSPVPLAFHCSGSANQEERQLNQLVGDSPIAGVSPSGTELWSWGFSNYTVGWTQLAPGLEKKKGTLKPSLLILSSAAQCRLWPCKFSCFFYFITD